MMVDGTTPDTEEQFTEEVAGWATKRDRGETYVMGTGTWSCLLYTSRCV